MSWHCNSSKKAPELNYIYTYQHAWIKSIYNPLDKIFCWRQNWWSQCFAPMGLRLSKCIQIQMWSQKPIRSCMQQAIEGNSGVERTNNPLHIYKLSDKHTFTNMNTNTHIYINAHTRTYTSICVDKVKIFSYVCVRLYITYSLIQQTAPNWVICVRTYSQIWQSKWNAWKLNALRIRPVEWRNEIYFQFQCNASVLRFLKIFSTTFYTYSHILYIYAYVCWYVCVCLVIFLFMALHSGALCVSAHLCMCAKSLMPTAPFTFIAL